MNKANTVWGSNFLALFLMKAVFFELLHTHTRDTRVNTPFSTTSPTDVVVIKLELYTRS